MKENDFIIFIQVDLHRTFNVRGHASHRSKTTMNIKSRSKLLRNWNIITSIAQKFGLNFSSYTLLVILKKNTTKLRLCSISRAKNIVSVTFSIINYSTMKTFKNRIISTVNLDFLCPQLLKSKSK